MTLILDILIVVLIGIGATFLLIGSYGLIKLPDPMSRLHAPTKSSTLGVGSLLIASMLNAWVHHDPSVHEVLVMAFLFVSAPISGNFISKTHLHMRRNDTDLPCPPEEKSWASTAPVKND
ncbi:Na+/H+ antiporter subunit G [Salipiger sp. IMCC34102]|uniref:Na+/H+ antiporter subunit G n=1 Tax=Salipiger sp. IMCC34102 TaxID=2510647 RepID=UPI00101CCB82|nr:Na+/H+ antiporter subunit G [Salipiger sp. IMCC34102]RYH01281.1 Na+/H+ antiporter subunit G [Salipiger sp. IMCC34102]